MYNVYTDLFLVVLQLLKGCRSASSEQRILFGECLGDLGAIDPGRMPPLTLGSSGRKQKFIVGVLEPEFRRELMVGLCQAYTRSDRKSQVRLTCPFPILTNQLPFFWMNFLLCVVVLFRTVLGFPSKKWSRFWEFPAILRLNRKAHNSTEVWPMKSEMP